MAKKTKKKTDDVADQVVIEEYAPKAKAQAAELKEQGYRMVKSERGALPGFIVILMERDCPENWDDVAVQEFE